MAKMGGSFLYDQVLPRIEPIYWLLAGVGLGFRYFLLRGSSTLLIVGLGGLVPIYFLRAFAPEVEESGPELSAAYSPASESPSLLKQFLYIASALTLLGILFKLLFWNGQVALLAAGVTTLLATISIKWAAGRFIRSVSLIAGLGIITWLMPTETLIQAFYHDDPALVEKMIFQHHHPGDKAASTEVTRLLAAQRNR